MKPIVLPFAICLAVSFVVSAQTPPNGLTEAVQTFAETSEAVMFKHFATDLDGDRDLDALVLLTDSHWCGSGGCTLVVFKKSRGKYVYLSHSTVTDTPIRLLPERSRGWKTLVVYSKGMGEVTLRFDGKRYPLNPSLQPRATKAQLRASRIVIE